MAPKKVSETPKLEMHLADDRPSADHDDDRLGLLGVADHLAVVLSQTALRSGFVIGIEGPWGSGKSTLIQLAKERLKDAKAPPQTIVFNPWLVGDRDSLLAGLFGDIADAIERMEDRSESLVEKAGEGAVSVAKRIRSYAVHLTAASKTADLIGLLLPGASGVGKGIEFVTQTLSKFADAAEAIPGDRPLGEQKRELETSLRALPAPIVVFVDDLERLEPEETMEMIRLIRAVGDLPNIIYVLCYDREVLIANIEQALSITKGARYLEKIVQVSLPLPQPEAFTLRRWFYDECVRLGGVDPRSSSDGGRRLHRVIDQEGGQRLETPRDVVRAGNALKLFWAPIREYVDFADLVWIQLVRLKSPDLYAWIESYLIDFGAVALSAATMSKPKKVMRRLKRVLKNDPEGFVRAVYRLRSILPGLKVAYDKDKKPYAEGFSLDRDELKKLTRDRRLGSPHYFRYYFSFGPAAGETHERKVREILDNLSQSPRAFEKAMQHLAGEKREAGGVLLAPMIDRLSAVELSGDEAATVVRALSNCMDIASSNDVETFSVKRSWEAGERLWESALRAIDQPQRLDVLLSATAHGHALGWIARCIRHGRMDAHKSSNYPLTVEELRLASDCFSKRLEKDTNVMTSAWLGGIFYLWGDVIGKERVKEKVAERTTDDVDFMRFLHSLRSWIGADRTYRPLSPSELEDFLDFAEARRRAEGIALRKEHYPEDVQLLILEVMEGFADGDEHPNRVKFSD